MAGRASAGGFWRPALVVVVFAASATVESVRHSSLSSIGNADFWWHLQTGIGILARHALPHSAWGSQMSSAPWMASSWLYDLGAAALYQVFNLRAVVLLAVGFRVLLAGITFWLGGGMRGHFWRAVFLSSVAEYVLFSRSPLPAYCSILCFALELGLLLEFRGSHRGRTLYWLPGLFVLWANLDLHFVYGLGLLLFFGIVEFVEGWRFAHKIESSRMLAVLGASMVGSMVSPYGWKPYAAFFAQWTSAANIYVADQKALHFRNAPDYVLMLLVMAAFLALGLRNSRDFFQIGLLVGCAFLAFHANADAWLAVMASAGVLGATNAAQPFATERGLNAWQLAGAVALSVVVASVPLMRHSSDRASLLAEVGNAYPVAAADYIRGHHLAQPIFNCSEWGGFLQWYLPEYPVAIDGRTQLYGDDYAVHYAKVMQADEHYSTFAPLNEARTVILQKNSLMGTALASVPSFKTAYSDEVAIVLTREQDSQ